MTAGAVTGVKNQGKCGACWAFSVVGAIEGLTFLEGNRTLMGLSEGALLKCDKKSHGCKGDNSAQAMSWVHGHRGLPSLREHPYASAKQKGNKGACNATRANGTDRVHHRRPQVSPARQRDRADGGRIAAADFDRHPGQLAWLSALQARHFSRQVWRQNSYVGYVDANISAGNATSWCDADGCKYWKIKNSWTHHWGDQGYIRMARDLKHVGECGLATQAAFSY